MKVAVSLFAIDQPTLYQEFESTDPHKAVNSLWGEYQSNIQNEDVEFPFEGYFASLDGKKAAVLEVGTYLIVDYDREDYVAGVLVITN